MTNSPEISSLPSILSLPSTHGYEPGPYNGISMPFLQRDLHIKDGSALNVVLQTGREAVAA